MCLVVVSIFEEEYTLHFSVEQTELFGMTQLHIRLEQIPQGTSQ